LRRRQVWMAAGWATLSLLAVGCGSSSSGGSTGPTSNAALLQFNASHNNGRTVRWPNLPVSVFLGNGVAREDEVTAWTSATGGAVTFTFVGSPGNADIRFRFTSSTGFCGNTSVEFTDDGRLTQADTEVSQSIYRSGACVRTVTHETAHGIGFFGHTSDGGLMDDDGGNGSITSRVTSVLRDLYSLSPGTFVTAEARRFGLQRPGGGKKVITFTYPVRQ
jgi:hypothetical protein